jgi:hypothetical protein
MYSEIYNIKLSAYLKVETIDELIEHAQTKDDIEGYVIEFEDGTMAKIKTNWYRERHHTLWDCNLRENVLIPLILDEKMDDIYSMLTPGTTKEERVKDIVDKTTKSYHRDNKEIHMLKNEYRRMDDRKSFALSYSKNRLFGCFMMMLRGDLDDEVYIKEKLIAYIKKYTYQLKNAIDWMEY